MTLLTAAKRLLAHRYDQDGLFSWRVRGEDVEALARALKEAEEAHRECERIERLRAVYRAADALDRFIDEFGWDDASAPIGETVDRLHDALCDYRKRAAQEGAEG